MLTISVLAVAVLVPATAAQGATSLVATVRGFGHGVGMSQYGALGYAQHGWTADRILAHYYTGTALTRRSSSPAVKVLLQSAHSSYAITGASSVGGQLLNPAKTYIAARGGDGLVLRDSDGKDLFTTTGSLALVPAAGAAVTLRGPAQNGTSNGSYRGAIQVSPGAGGLAAVNVLSLENYVAGVVSAEVPASWPAEALRAQAIAARTYAVTTNAGGAAGLFTQYADTRSQMYRGVAAETPATTAAVRTTSGQIVTYQGTPAATFFFSTSGGRTENVENSFVGSDPKPWLKSVADPYDTTSPYHRPTTIRMTLTRATNKLSGLIKGRLRKIRVLKRGVSPRIVRAQLVGTAGTTTVTGPQLRRAFGLRDTWIRFRTFSTDVSNQITPPVVPAVPPTTGDSTTGGAAASALRLRAHGVIAPATKGSWASFERKVGNRWERAVDVQIGSGGSYSTTLPQPGRYRLRYGGQTGPEVTAR